MTESTTVNGYIIKNIDKDQPNEETGQSAGESAALLCPHGGQGLISSAQRRVTSQDAPLSCSVQSCFFSLNIYILLKCS